MVLGWALIWSGLLLFGYVGFHLFVTDWLNAGSQAEAAGDLQATLDGSQPEREEIDVDELLGGEPSDPPEVVDYFPEEPVERGKPFAFLSIPKIGLDEVVVYEGVDRQTLRSGPGHMTGTPLPGQPGNAVVSGHRTTYGRPFFDFDQLEPGDRVEVESDTGIHVYEVREIAVVLPTDVWVIDPRDGGWLTLTTCEPKFSARQRLIVWAEMVEGPNADYIELSALRSS